MGEPALFNMQRSRRCNICGSRLAAKKGHGFVVDNGKMIVCSDYKRHQRIRKGITFNYGQEIESQETEAAEA